MANPAVASAVHARLRYLIVDEYQDVNPAQERLIQLLTGREVELCVVGDDDQAIYQWRGSDVRNIVGFSTRYPGVQTFTIARNRRSRPYIVQKAAEFARSIPGRLDKQMEAVRAAAEVELVTWSADTEQDECDRIAGTIQRLHAAGLAYRDIAVLVRGRVAYPELLDAFDAHGVPVQPAGRTALFNRMEAQLFGKTYAWLAGHTWSPEPYQWGEIPEDGEIFSEYCDVTSSPKTALRRSARGLLTLKASVTSEAAPVNLVADFYELLGDLGVAAWDSEDRW